MSELEKNYNITNEGEIYKKWEESGFFNPDNSQAKKVFSVLMPPPNVTGILHLGHAMENSLMDIEARFHRMKGEKTLFLPGVDHAAVATQAKVEAELMKQGIKNPRAELGREGLLAKIREYAETSKATIIRQIKRLGSSCDWSRLAYTFDEKRSAIVFELFKKMYEDQLIYRGYRTVNWSVKGQSTLSDDELEYIEEESTLYALKYSADFPIAISTTRPETKLGDTAVAVNPDDERYQKYIGQTFTVDLGLDKPLTIKVIGESEVDMNFGTGAVGVTPAHSQTDFAWYQKNKEIGLIAVIGKDGKMTDNAGKYAGQTVEECRQNFVAFLKDKNLLLNEEKLNHNVAISDRFRDEIEVLPMEQWFINVNLPIPGKNKSLKELMREAVTVGLNNNKNKKVNIVPERFTEAYLKWIDNLRDWCISRQIWWGHRIPIWYKGNEQMVSEENPGEGWEQDPDTLDTWFSSRLDIQHASRRRSKNLSSRYLDADGL